MALADNNITFYPPKRIGRLLFTYHEKDIVNVLGKPDKRTIDMFNDNEYAIYLYYNRMGLSPTLYFENNRFDYLSVHLKDIILENVKFSTLDKNSTLVFLENYHITHKINYVRKQSYDKDVNEECYEFENIGLTIWYERGCISDICVQKSND
jgi:hypothetical protein